VRASARPFARVLAHVLAHVPLSGLGATVAVVAVAAGLAAHALGWVELAVPAAALGGALLGGGLLAVGRSAYEIDLEMSDRRVTVGERAVGRIVVRNTSRRRLLPARIELPVGRGRADFPLPSLGPHGAHEELFAIPTTRRAVVPVGPVRSVRGDPLGLVRQHIRWTDRVEVYVHPRLVSLTGAASGVLRDLEGQATRVVSDSDLSFHALREYADGDDRRHIHWRSTARMGRLMVRQFEDTRRTHTVVALATDLADYADADEFEVAVAAAASIGVQAVRDTRELTVLAGDGALRSDTPGHLLDDVAALLQTVDGRGGASLGRWVVRQAPTATVAILVTGSVPARSALRAAAAPLPAGVRVLVLTVDAASAGEVVTHDRLSLARIGSLLDLPRVLRRAAVG